ncbi:MAG: hypothetical protein V4598_03595 [Bdellovibrionota bacterium]
MHKTGEYNSLSVRSFIVCFMDKSRNGPVGPYFQSGTFNNIRATGINVQLVTGSNRSKLVHFICI